MKLLSSTSVPVILAKLFRDYMNLEEDHVLIQNQRFKLPADTGAFLSIVCIAEKVFGANKHYRDNEDPSDPALALVEVVVINRQETYSVQIYSQDASAIAFKDVLIAALTSDLAQSAAEKYSIKFGQQPVGVVDLSAVEGAARLNRYGITFNVLSATKTERSVPYFNSFSNPPGIVINA